MMRVWPEAVWLCGMAFVLSLGLAGIAIVYARRRGLLDQPGRRRSHVAPTPRGGGIGLVGGALPVAVIALAGSGRYPTALVAACAVAAWLVAIAGWVDDHRDTSALARLLVQLLATALFAGVAIGTQGLSWAWLPVWIVLATWSINLHNFMDGIDAILGLQVAFVGAGLGVLAAVTDQGALALAAFGMGAAAIGFLVVNWPPARIFMGDVGSGFAGFLIFALIALLAMRVWLTLWPALILCSGFVVDAGLTLTWRMWRGKRWYTAHREHLYQWLVRSGNSHARASGFYLLWNAAVTAPLAACGVWQPHAAMWLCLGLYAVAGGLWWRLRRDCIERAQRKGGRHVA